MSEDPLKDAEPVKAYELRLKSQSLKLQRFESTVELIRIIGRFVLWAGFIGSALFVLVAQTGEETIVKYVAEFPVSKGFGWTVALALLVLFLNERRMRRDYIQQHHPEVQKSEKEIDSSRTSSGVTARGTTPKKDKR